MTAQSIEETRNSFEADLATVSDLAELKALEESFFGKSGPVRRALRSVGQLPRDERAAAGEPWVTFERTARVRVRERRDELNARELEERLSGEYVDVTLPGTGTVYGGIHPLRVVEQECLEILRRHGFELVSGREVESAFYNFDALNIPEYHPARQLQDTFWLENGALLRSHTTTVQARVLEQRPELPVKVASSGPVYRNEASDATHSSMFHQLEGFWLDEGLTLADLKGILRRIVGELYPGHRTRFKPKYYPYTEPSIGLDLACTACGGEGCGACHGSGWITLIGAGMIHPKVLRDFGYPPDVVGLAFGWGTTRMASQLAGLTKVKQLYGVQQRIMRQIHGVSR